MRKIHCLIAKYFLNKFAPDKNITFSHTAMNILMEYHWPGNVRELENSIERITTLSADQIITPQNLPPFLSRGSSFNEITSQDKILPLKQFSIMAEGQYILSVLKKMDQNKSKVAEKLEVDITTLNRKLDKFERIQNS